MFRPEWIRALDWRRHGTALAIVLAGAAATMGGPWIPAPPGIAWPPAGVLLAILLIAGRGAWLPAFLGVLAGATFATAAWPVGLVIAAAATAQAAVGAWFVNRWSGGLEAALSRTRHFARLAVLTGVVAAAVGPFIGYPALTLIGRAPRTPATAVALSWWLTDGVSTLVIVPFVVMWWHPKRFASLVRREVGEGLALTAVLAATWIGLFGPSWPEGMAREPLEVLCVPGLLWAAYRFGPRIASLASFGLALVVVAATRAGFGPFADLPAEGVILATDVFLGVCVVTTLALALVTRERRVAERSLLALARTDGLTGLANYRAFAGTLEDEIARSGRTGHGFALLFIDVDRLKQINDTHGHIAGNHAIVRVARALEVNCRAMDTAARIGGDEFCVLMPQTDAEAAGIAATRIRQSLTANARTTPHVAVSCGVAMYPADGATAEQLLAAADRLLYAEKSRRVPVVPEQHRTRERPTLTPT